MSHTFSLAPDEFTEKIRLCTKYNINQVLVPCSFNEQCTAATIYPTIDYAEPGGMYEEPELHPCSSVGTGQ